MIKVIKTICFCFVIATFVVGGIAFNCLGEEYETLRIAAYILLILSSWGGVYITLTAGVESKIDKDSAAYKQGYNAGYIMGEGKGFLDGWESAYKNEGLRILCNLQKEKQDEQHPKVSEEAR